MEDLKNLAIILHDAELFLDNVDNLQGKSPGANRAILDLVNALIAAQSRINEVLRYIQLDKITI